MSDPYIGQINIFAFDYAPQDWALANGAILPIAQNQALYALLGTRYGGDGRNTFALPNLCGRLPIGEGNGAGMTLRTGQTGGAEFATLSVNQMPGHTHTAQISATASNATTSAPAAGAYLAKTVDGGGVGSVPNIYYSGATPPLVALSGGGTSSTGGGQPVSLMNPFLALNFSIALLGLFPARP
jgi:microcystin-dependent protein